MSEFTVVVMGAVRPRLYFGCHCNEYQPGYINGDNGLNIPITSVLIIVNFAAEKRNAKILI